MSSTDLPSDIDSQQAIRTYRSQRDGLTYVLQHQLPNIANKLYSKSIIPRPALTRAMNEFHEPDERAVNLLNVVEDKIRAEPHVFTEFVKVLESVPFFKPQAKQLVDKYLEGKSYNAAFQFIVALIFLNTPFRAIPPIL